MNMLGLAPKLTEADWELIEHCLTRDPFNYKTRDRYELLLWNREKILEAVHNWAMYGNSLSYLDNEIELLKKLGWDGVRRDD